MRAIEDGWIDKRHVAAVPAAAARARSANEVRADTDAFRGRVFTFAYRLERKIDELIVWHLFRDRDDGMAAAFEADILNDGGIGLERKVRLAKKISEYWLFEDGESSADYGRDLAEAKAFRDRAAHWPTRLLPIVDPSDAVIDFLTYIEKGDTSIALDGATREIWLDTIERVSNHTQLMIDRIVKDCREAD